MSCPGLGTRISSGTSARSSRSTGARPDQDRSVDRDARAVGGTKDAEHRPRHQLGGLRRNRCTAQTAAVGVRRVRVTGQTDRGLDQGAVVLGPGHASCSAVAGCPGGDRHQRGVAVLHLEAGRVDHLRGGGRGGSSGEAATAQRGVQVVLGGVARRRGEPTRTPEAPQRAAAPRTATAAGRPPGAGRTGGQRAPAAIGSASEDSSGIESSACAAASRAGQSAISSGGIVSSNEIACGEITAAARARLDPDRPGPDRADHQRQSAGAHRSGARDRSRAGPGRPGRPRARSASRRRRRRPRRCRDRAVGRCRAPGTASRWRTRTGRRGPGLWSGPTAASAVDEVSHGRAADDLLPQQRSGRWRPSDREPRDSIGPISTGQRPGTWLARQPATLLLIGSSSPAAVSQPVTIPRLPGGSRHRSAGSRQRRLLLGLHLLVEHAAWSSASRPR